MKMDQYRLGFIGFGHMGQILCERILAARIIPHSQIQFAQRDPDRIRQNEQKYGITATSLKHLINSSDILFLCVRPVHMALLAGEMGSLGMGGKKVLSVLAGLPISFFQKHFGAQVEVARVMPNVASAIGEGMTILSFPPHISSEFRSLTERLVAPFGRFLEVDESRMDAATAVAGSGPGFVFKLIEAMAEGGKKAGLSFEESLLMAAQTFIGSAKLVANGSDLSSLMNQIATPGGTTEAGFQVMQQAEIAKHFQQAIQATVQKAKSLANSVHIS